MGKPELLKGNYAVFCSPRIIDEYRLVYEKKRNVFLICRASFIIKNKLPERKWGSEKVLKNRSKTERLFDK